MEIGDRIKKKRLELGLTQKQLGELCGMADSNLRAYELGKVKPKIVNTKRIASALGVSVAYLMGWNEHYEFRDSPGGEVSPETIQAVKAWVMDKKKKRMMDAFEQLNEAGQDKAIERVEELTKNTQYKKEEPSQCDEQQDG